MVLPVVAAQDSDYVFNTPDECGVPLERIFDHYLPLPKSDYAVPLPGLDEPGYSLVYRNVAVKTTKKALMRTLDTYHGLWKNAAKHFAARPAFASRPYNYHTGQSEPEYVNTTFADVEQQKLQLGAGILFLLRNNPYKNQALEPHRKIDSHVADYRNYDKDNISFVVTLFSGNRAEWVLSDLACVSYSITNTVLYDTLGPSASEYILELTESPMVICSYAHLRTIVELKRQNPEKLEALISIICMDPLDCISEQEAQSLVFEARSVKIELCDLNQACGIGKLFPLEELPPQPKTAYTISFTSGTTGSAPKGVMLTHESAASGICFIACCAPYVKDDTEMAFLPLAHIFERQALAFNLCKGGRLGFPQLNGTPLTLLEDLKLLKPKHMANVPRVYTKFEAAIKNATLNSDSGLKRALFTKVVGTKAERQALAEHNEGRHWVYDRLFLPKVRQALGFDNMVYVITGLAPISPETVKFMKASLGIGFSQGYGLTESFAGFSFSGGYEQNPGSCGAPGVCSTIRVRELPSLGYTLDDPRGPSGELEILGPQIFTHYFKNPEETAKVLKNGWFATGDVARIDKTTGRLYIVDRVKNFFKLAQGEYVTPEKVENVYLLANPLLTQCFVHGDSLRHFLVAVVGVDPEKIVKFLVQNCAMNKAELTCEKEILHHANKKENRTRLLHELNGNIKGLQGFELVQNLFVEFEPLRLDRDVITPTVKIRRPIAAKFFKDQIEGMYEESSLVSKQKL